MKRIYVVTEGQSETNFVNRVLVPYFCPEQKLLIPTTVVTKSDERTGRMYKGGMRNYSKARLTIRKALSYTNTNEPNVYVTTMFDFYALPDDTPGLSMTNGITDAYQKASSIEKEMLDSEALGKPVFKPYIQLHEFEALLFTNLDRLAEEYFEYDIRPLRDCLAQKGNPELINDGAGTAPSKRILQCIPDYDKATGGVSILEKIGVDALCQSCRHFSEWIYWIKGL